MKRLILYILAIGGGLLFMIPLAWTVSTALKSKQQLNAPNLEWIPRSYRIVDTDGQPKPITIIARVDQPAALIKLLEGPRTGESLPVARSAMSNDNGIWRVKLRAPEPFACDIVTDFPQGVAQVRIADVPATKSDRFVAINELKSYVDPQWKNFKTAWTALPLPFHKFVLNTYTITILNIIGQTFSCSLVAYGFARFKFRGRNALFMVLLSTMMLPGQVTMIPIFLIWKKLGLIDTFAPLTIPSFFATSAFNVFLLRQFFMGLPRDLDEAAMLDGCGPIRIWWTILMPLCKPALTTVAVLAFIGQWDDFLGPLIYLNRLENYTVSIALRMFQDQNGTDYNLLMAAALIHIVPVVLLFFFAQRYFIKGIAMSGMKG